MKPAKAPARAVNYGTALLDAINTPPKQKKQAAEAKPDKKTAAPKEKKHGKSELQRRRAEQSAQRAVISLFKCFRVFDRFLNALIL